MAVKKQIYIEAELDWAETKLKEWKEYVDDNPFPTLTHDIEYKPTKGGGLIPMVIASKESKIKCLRDTMKEYLELLKVVKTMRADEQAKKKDVKGGEDRPDRM